MLEQSRVSRSERRGWTEEWWKKHLSVHDFMPNENLIQYRGPQWNVVHKMLYVPAAKNASVNPLEYKQWKACSATGCRLLGESLPGCDAKSLRYARSARHSKFAECDRCHELKKRYMDLMNDPGASQEQRQEAFEELKAHMDEWTADRARALSMKYLASAAQSGGDC